MIKIFSAIDTSFNTNGDVCFEPYKAIVRKADNSDYYLDLVCDLKYVDYLKSENIVVVKLPQGEQAFRISDFEVDGKRFTAKCWHLFYDTKNYLIVDNVVINRAVQFSLSYFGLMTQPIPIIQKYTFASDIEGLITMRIVRKSMFEVIQRMLEEVGGHLVRDNYNIALKNSIANDYGLTIEYGKNIKEISCETDWSEVVTKILPVGKDGALLNLVTPSADKFITSTTQYDIPYCKTVSFNQDINEEDYPTEAQYKQAIVDDLTAQATAYLNEHCVPKVNYTLKAHLDDITDIGDVILVKDSRLGVELLTNVLAFEYDCIQERYTSIEFGNYRNNLQNLMSNIEKMINRTITERNNNG